MVVTGSAAEKTAAFVVFSAESVGRFMLLVLSAIGPRDCRPQDVMATISGVEGVKRDALPEMPIVSGQGAA